jgi:integrase
MKIQPKNADFGDHLRLKASWTKGGKARSIPISNPYQREILDKAHVIAGSGSLIPARKTYAEQLHLYEGITKRAGLSKMHGLRHAYAQKRYEELTGRQSPACGGKTSKELSKSEKVRDREARLVISRELGHEREQITAVYLGR